MLLAAPGDAFESPAYLGQFIGDTNKILEIREGTVSPTLDEMRKMSALGCNAIRRLVADKQFQADMVKGSGISVDTYKARRALAQNLATFTNTFLPSEETVLLKAGVKPEIAKRLMWSASALHTFVDAKFDGSRIIGGISDLGKELCAAADAVQQEQNSEDAAAKYRLWTFRIGGVVFIVADLAMLSGAIPVTAGASGTLITGSTSIGFGIVTWGEMQKK